MIFSNRFGFIPHALLHSFDISLALLWNVPYCVSFFVECDFDGLADEVGVPVVGAVECGSSFFRVHVFISKFLSSGNVVIVRTFLCIISHGAYSCLSSIVFRSPSRSS